MKPLLESLQDWLAKNRADVGAYSLLAALTAETLKRVDSPDPSQREFDAEALSVAAGGPDGFDAAKRWVDRAKLESFADARRPSLEDHFRAAGHSEALRVVRRSPRGKHRAVWFLAPYPLTEPQADVADSTSPVSEGEPLGVDAIVYDFTPPGQVRPAWYARLLIGTGSFVTRSWRGLLWVAFVLIPVAFVLLSVVTVFGLTGARRPVQTADIATLLLTVAMGWLIWRMFLRPVVWLLEDRIALATELWVAWGEDPAQLELAKDEHGRRRLQLVRYAAVCPVCAGTIELRYSGGINRRRLVGCCSEVPHEHQYTFDRILRKGHRLPQHQE